MGKKTGKAERGDIPASNGFHGDRHAFGFDGHPAEFIEARDIEVYVDNDCGIPVREKSTSPQNINIDRIEWMFHHRQIEARQYEAARRLQADWEMALINPVASSLMVGSNSGTAQLPNDAKCDAMKRHGAAVKYLGYDWKIVDLVVHGCLTVVQASRVLRLHHQKAAGQLWSALHHLADHYGFPREQHIGNEKILRAAS